MTDELEGIQKMAKLWHYPGIYKEGMWETTKCQVRIVHVPAGI
jgi:hypothetical protein